MTSTPQQPSPPLSHSPSQSHLHLPTPHPSQPPRNLTDIKTQQLLLQTLAKTALSKHDQLESNLATFEQLQSAGDGTLVYDESDIYVDAYRDVHKLTQLLKHHDTKWRGLLKTMAQEKKNALRLICKTTKTVKSGGKGGHKSGGTKSGSKSGSKSESKSDTTTQPPPKIGGSRPAGRAPKGKEWCTVKGWVDKSITDMASTTATASVAAPASAPAPAPAMTTPTDAPTYSASQVPLPPATMPAIGSVGTMMMVDDATPPDTTQESETSTVVTNPPMAPSVSAS